MPLLRRNLGCVFQDFKLLPNRTAAENIGYALRVQGQSDGQIRKKVPEVMDLVGLAHKMGSRPEEPLRRRAATRLDRAGDGEPSAAPRL